MADSVYIHIPFCKSKCKYCSFVSFPKFDREYFDYLVNEIKEFYNGESLKTLYFGGGTPSTIEIPYIERIISQFHFQPGCEITFEMNPDDANLNYLKSLKKLGINRLSMGAQSFDDNILQLIGRRHSSKETLNAVNLAKEAGFQNISLDLIYGLSENQDIDKDLDNLLKLNIQHISTYGLKIEEGSYFYNHPENFPDEDFQAEAYLRINQRLEHAGFYRYEISNFAKKGFESKHNLNYWNNTEYYGFGISAHGYLNEIRYSNKGTLLEYKKQFRESEHKLTSTEKLEEEIFLGFRKDAGIDIEKIKKDFNIDFESKYGNVLKKYSPKYISKTLNGYKLTLDGILLSNIILADFLE